MPIVFLDFDDVICLNAPYGVYDVAAHVAPPASGDTRADAIAGWLRRNPGPQPYTILDDVLSGTGLAQSPMAPNTVLCAADEGLMSAHLDDVRRILRCATVNVRHPRRNAATHRCPTYCGLRAMPIRTVPPAASPGSSRCRSATRQPLCPWPLSP
jgi:hypothetical protein